MTSPSRLLQAIVKTDPEVGRVFMYDVAMQLGTEAMRDLKAEIAKELPDYLSRSSIVLRRSLGRDYVSKAANGTSPVYDPKLVAAYEAVVKAYNVVKALEVDSFDVRGNKMTIFRDTSTGRFARQGIATPGTTPEARGGYGDIGQKFYHPKAGPGIKADAAQIGARKWIAPRGTEGAFTEPMGTEQEEQRLSTLATPGIDPGEEKRIVYGLHAQQTANELTDLLTQKGVIDASKTGASMERQAADLKVTAATVTPGGQKDQVELTWDKEAQTFRLPAYARIGQAIEGYAVEGRTDTANAALRNVRGEGIENTGGRVPLLELTVPVSHQDLSQMRIGDLTGGNLETSRTGLAAKRVGVLGRAMQKLGIKGGKNVESIGGFMGSVDTDAELRRTLTQTGWRFRGIDAPTLSPSIQVAAEGPKPAQDGFTEARYDYYNQALPPSADIGDAVEMGQTRDYTTMALWARQKARTSDAGMGVSASSSGVNYNDLAQRISQGIGRGMPSEGVLMDRKGKVISQSMGITHDGYLPFNAEAMAKLSGGQYVRTRQLGGVTGEDLRTLLIGNGRAAQVVSNSGVYELEMDPSLRGTRRYTDTTMQMLDTYDRILDEVAQGGHYAVPLPAANEKKARETAAIRGGNTEAGYKKALAEARHEQYNSIAQLSDKDISDLRQSMERGLREEFAVRYGPKELTREGKQRPTMMIPATPTPEEENFIQQRVSAAANEQSEQRARMLSLNAEGYALALKTLQQYYPYMIRTARYRSWDQFNEEAGEKANKFTGRQMTQRGSDKWYSKPGMLRPTAAGRVTEGEGSDVPFAQTGRPAMGAREKFGEQLKQIRPGAKVAYTTATAAPGTTAATGTTGAGNVSGRFGERIANLQRVTQQGLQQYNGIQPEGANATVVDSDIGQAADSKNKVRLALQMYSQNPQQLVSVLDGRHGEGLLKAFADPTVPASLATDRENPITFGGTQISQEQAMDLIYGVQATLAAQNYSRNTASVEPDIDNVRSLPEGTGPVMINEGTMTSTQVRDKISSNTTLATALRNYDQIRLQSDTSHLEPYAPMATLDKATGIATKMRMGEGYDNQVMDTFNAIDNDVERLEFIRSQGDLDDKEVKAVAAILSVSGKNRVLAGDSQEAASEIKNGYRLGHGLWIQNYVHGKADRPDSATSFLARAPGLGQSEEEIERSRVGKSLGRNWRDRELEDFLLQTLDLDLTPSASRRR